MRTIGILLTYLAMLPFTACSNSESALNAEQRELETEQTELEKEQEELLEEQEFIEGIDVARRYNIQQQGQLSKEGESHYIRADAS